jgi:hypothetical protein
MQVTYVGNKTIMRGSKDGHAGTPDACITLAPYEQLIMSGAATSQQVVQLQFTSSTGKVYGPYGVPTVYEDPVNAFSVNGYVLSFFGTVTEGQLTGLGVWNTPLPVVPPGSIQSPTFGGLDGSTWQQGPFTQSESHFLI